MRIAYLHQYFNTPRMAGSTRSYEIARRLVLRGHDVHVVTSNCLSPGSAAAWTETREEGIHVHWVSVPYSNHMSSSQRCRAFAQFAWRSAGRAAGLKADVIFATSTPLTIVLPGLYAAKRARIPFVFEVRDLWPEIPIALGAIKNPLLIRVARALESLAYRQAEHIIALSPTMRDGIVQRGVAPERVSVIPNSCDFDLFDVSSAAGEAFREEQAWLGDQPLVSYVGTMGIVNGVEYLANLAAEVHKLDPAVRFLVVGGGRCTEAVRATAERRGVLNRNFFMWGPVPKQEVPRIVSASTLGTSLCIDNPALQANSANKVFDTLAGGRPLAVNHEGWIAQLIRERGLGIVFDPQELQGTAQRLVRFLRDPQAIRQAEAAAHRTGRELFERGKLATSIEQILRESVQGKQVTAVCHC